MLPYSTVEAAETALGRSLTAAETLWLKYSANKSDYFLYCHNIIFLFLIFSIFPFYYLFLEHFFNKSIKPYKIQPKANLSFSDTIHCYKSVMRMFFLVVGPLQLVSYPSIQVHHEYTAPIGFAAPYAHWAEILILGIPSFLGPAIAPGHIVTFWMWIAFRQIEAIETHSGYDLPWTPTKYIPFYGGPDYHDYHHYVGGQSQSNFASVFTYCDYIYGTDKGYRYQKKALEQLQEEQKTKGGQNGVLHNQPAQGYKVD
ncbi:methylsterol monooxygenase 1-1 [Phtheirospermum japonicum]|uniref:Methylsterol monooxygenase 1-1 n=1 Tax=Phtheirospermum japonicum TaxID=374723 RepID=A0A830B2E1_9LAMI|nr:methylsterol monooxygenase 1-1 [Phtheirospermum japonicum]